MYMEEWWDTTALCETFNVNGACTMLVEVGGELASHRPFTGGMTGRKHTEETREKMSKSMTGIPKPSLHKGGKIMKDGEIVEFDCISDVCRKLNLRTSHVCELLKGKRRSVKGWVSL